MSDLLNGHFQILFEPYRIHDMPPVQSVCGNGIESVYRYGSAHRTVIRISHKRCTVCPLFSAHRSVSILFIKTPCSAHVIFDARTAYRRVFRIAVYIHFNFTFAPPIAFQCRPRKIRSDVMSVAFYIVDDDIIFADDGIFCTAPLRVKIRSVFGNAFQRII